MKEAPPPGGFGDQKGTALGPVVELDPTTGEIAAAEEETSRKPSKGQAVLAACGWICLVPSFLLMLLVIFGSLMTLATKCGDPSGPSHEGSRAVLLLIIIGFYVLPALPAWLFLTRRSKTTSGAIGGFLFSIFALVTSVLGVGLSAVSHMC